MRMVNFQSKNVNKNTQLDLMEKLRKTYRNKSEKIKITFYEN